MSEFPEILPDEDILVDVDLSDEDLDHFGAVGKLIRCTFDGSSLDHAFFMDAVLEDCSFRRAFLGSTSFIRCRLVRCDFSDVLGTAYFLNCTFEDTVKPAAA